MNTMLCYLPSLPYRLSFVHGSVLASLLSAFVFLRHGIISHFSSFVLDSHYTESVSLDYYCF
jgi:hypothetical protein